MNKFYFSSGTCLSYVNFNGVLSGVDYLSAFEDCSEVLQVHIVGGGTDKVDIFEWLSFFGDFGIEYFFAYYAASCEVDSSFYFPASLKTLSIGTVYSTSGEVSISNFDRTMVSDSGTSLEAMTINGTNLSNLKFLNGLNCLKTLNLNYNNFSTLEGVTSTLPNVTSLNLSYNNITSLYGIQYFTGLKTLNLSYNTSLGDTCSYGGTTYFNLQLLSDLCTNNQTLTSINLTGCTDLNTDSTNTYWTTLKGLSGLTVTGP